MKIDEKHMTLRNGLDPTKAYDIFKKAYETNTGNAWTYDKFLSRARNWTFFGDDTGFVAVRYQDNDKIKLVGMAGNPKAILKGLDELLANGGQIWGMVSLSIAKMAKKRGFIVPTEYPGGSLFMRTLYKAILPKLKSFKVSKINDDGSLTFDYSDIGNTTKYMIGNREYFINIIKLPELMQIISNNKLLYTFLKFLRIL